MAEAIGDILAAIVERCERLSPFHAVVETISTAAVRKAFILRLYEQGTIWADDAELLIQAYQLETA